MANHRKYIFSASWQKILISQSIWLVFDLGNINDIMWWENVGEGQNQEIVRRTLSSSPAFPSFPPPAPLPNIIWRRKIWNKPNHHNSSHVQPRKFVMLVSLQLPYHAPSSSSSSSYKAAPPPLPQWICHIDCAHQGGHLYCITNEKWNRKEMNKAHKFTIATFHSH